MARRKREPTLMEKVHAKMAERHVSEDGRASWPAVASRADRVQWAREILESELTVQLEPPRIDTDYELRQLAGAIVASLAWNDLRRTFERRNEDDRHG